MARTRVEVLTDLCRIEALERGQPERPRQSKTGGYVHALMKQVSGECDGLSNEGALEIAKMLGAAEDVLRAMDSATTTGDWWPELAKMRRLFGLEG